MENLCSTNNIHYENVDVAVAAVNNGANMGWQPLLALKPTDDNHDSWMRYAYLMTCVYNKDKIINRRFSILRNS